MVKILHDKHFTNQILTLKNISHIHIMLIKQLLKLIKQLTSIYDNIISYIYY